MNYWLTIYKVAWVILAALFLIGLACIFMPKCNRERELHRKKIELEQQNRDLTERAEDLKIKQERFRSDPDFVERTARDAGMLKPDEVLFLFPETNASTEKEIER